MIESAPCGYVTLLPNGRIHHVNRTLSRWLDIEASLMCGNRFSDYLNMGGRIYYETHIAPLLRMQGFFNEFAIDMIAGDGTALQVIANAVEGRDDAGKPQFIRLAIFKAVDRRRYERELLRANETARHLLKDEQASSELREQFIAVLGHDLRNPLASISAGARVLGRTIAGEKDRSILAMMEVTVRRMVGLIDDILDFARGRLGGGITLSRAQVPDLRQVIEQIVDELRVASPDRVIETEIDLKDTVSCDRSRLGQLMSNLLGNALTHGDNGQPVRVRASTKAGQFTFQVANSGQQIPHEARDKLFEPFVRGELQDNRHGLGLGLYIASQIAQAHGGRLSVESSPEETQFTFKMPLSANGV